MTTESWIDAAPDARLFYTTDDYTDPWSTPETVLLVHGLAESGRAWNAWVPHLAWRYRVLRIDQRGFGASTPVRRDFTYTLDMLGNDLASLIEKEARGPVHVVGAKIGATISAHFAARRPDLVKTLTLIGLPVIGPQKRIGPDPEVTGVRGWARATMDERLGREATPGMLEGWSDLMGVTPLSTFLAFTRSTGGFDVTEDLARIAAPVLVLSSDSARHPVAEAQTWRSRVQRSELVTIPGEGYHAAAVFPDACAQAVLAFIERH